MQLHEFYTAICQRADTSSTSINAAEVHRVMACAFDVMLPLPVEDLLDLLCQGLRKAKARLHGPQTETTSDTQTQP